MTPALVLSKSLSKYVSKLRLSVRLEEASQGTQGLVMGFSMEGIYSESPGLLLLLSFILLNTSKEPTLLYLLRSQSFSGFVLLR